MVVGGEPGLALAFFFGDEFGAFAAFSVDAVAAVLVTGGATSLGSTDNKTLSGPRLWIAE